MGLSTWNIDSSDKHKMDKILKLQQRMSVIFDDCLIIIYNIEMENAYMAGLHLWQNLQFRMISFRWLLFVSKWAIHLKTVKSLSCLKPGPPILH